MKKKQKDGLTPTDSTLREVMSHYNMWTEDNEKRRTRLGGWNDITDAYWGKLPADWPYTARVTMPVIRTTIIEKNGRLLNSKLRGRLVPREGGDVLKARLNNAILDFQWDTAKNGGSMLEKWGMMDQDTRLYCSKFGLVKWLHKTNDEGDVLFDGNEFTPLDIRDCGMDPGADHIRNANWFQAREWPRVADLERLNDTSSDEPMYPGLGELKVKMSEKSDRRDNAYENRILSLKGLTDRVGDDKYNPIVELVTEYRNDKWVTFAPTYKVILREIDNPYEHGKIPVVQLRYYSIQGDPLGESEVEPVLPIWRAIQATLCGYLDNMNIHIRPPLKIVDGQVRIETIVYGAEAQWVMDRLDSVQELQSNGEAMQYFQTTLQALLSAFANAMGDISQGVSSVDPTNSDKTATEIKNSAKQQNVRDQKNQTSLAEALEDMMQMWLSNNKQFLFADPEKQNFILKIVGSEMFNYFKRMGLDEMELPPESMTAISQIIEEQGGNLSDDDLTQLIDAGKMPKYPVHTNPKEKNPENFNFKPKMEVNEMGDAADITVLPEDVEDMFDYVADVKSMSTGAGDELMEARQKFMDRVTNPQIAQMLQMEGSKPQIKELLVQEAEDSGLKDAERFFGQADQPQMPGAPQPGMPGMDPNAPQDPMMAQAQQIVQDPNAPMPNMAQQQFPM